MKVELKSLSINIVALCSILLFSPMALTADKPKSNQFWWPNQLDLNPLRLQSMKTTPYGKYYHYAEEFKTLDLDVVKEDIEQALTTSQPWWPADFGHYGPLMIRMAWHSAGTYRVGDGRGGADGGQQRFDPLNSWPDNANLDKARRLLWPIKQKYGRKLSWADLMILAGNVSLESMGFKTYGFAGGREDDWQPDLVYWGPEDEFLADQRRTKKGRLKRDLAAAQMGLIYVNPEGPNGNSDPLAAAEDIRLSFGLMAMNDRETVALIAGGHTLGKAHGAKRFSECVGQEPAAAPLEEQGLGWRSRCGKGNAEHTTTSGLEGAWTSTPTAWSILYFDNLLRFDWIKVKSPAGATQWIPTDKSASELVPDAHIPQRRHAPIMFTTDIALKKDPIYREISEEFLKNPKEFDRAFAKAWFKLTHRDMGPRVRYVGSEVPSVSLIWQDPIPPVDHKLINSKEVEQLKRKILDVGIDSEELIRTAWASAASFRITDMRGGANGARIQLSPQKDWAVNSPKQLRKTLKKLNKLRKEFNNSLESGKQVSLADLIVLGGIAAIEQAATKASIKIGIPFSLGRTDALQSQTDLKSFNVLEPKADGFRNYFNSKSHLEPTEALVERASLLDLTIPEMTVLVGGLRVLNANAGKVKHGVLTKTPGVLTNDFFVNLLDMSTRWNKSKKQTGIYEGRDYQSGKLKWSATSVDLIFGSHPELRAVAEVYASNDSKEKFVQDFVSAWTKVMELDRFDLK